MKVELSRLEMANIIVAIEQRLADRRFSTAADIRRSEALAKRLDEILKKEGK